MQLIKSKTKVIVTYAFLSRRIIGYFDKILRPYFLFYLLRIFSINKLCGHHLHHGMLERQFYIMIFLADC